ncbi:TPA: hypothetical protein N0F65_003453 [Lagenidium giganteum]|uniref:Uncharacterized protein n=1 Tax=Lagenidium giganteum TaxID=4803 RepID=A0AAV2YPG2_9STRA|nr:TPA: hypothetical protein N0F65_003453 [Lagenidium giganteum]
MDTQLQEQKAPGGEQVRRIKNLELLHEGDRIVVPRSLRQPVKLGKKKHGKLPAMDVNKPWAVVCVDQIGPYTHHESGRKYYAMTTVDPATGWFEIKAISDQSSKTAAHVVGDMVRTRDLDKRTWEEILPSVAFAIRATASTTKQETPVQLVFGRDMIMHAAFVANWDRIRQRKLRQVERGNARENNQHLAHEYRVDDRVLIVKGKTRLTKLEQPTTGPFKIRQVNGNGTVVIQRHGYTETINMRRIVPYRAAVGVNAVSVFENVRG